MVSWWVLGGRRAGAEGGMWGGGEVQWGGEDDSRGRGRGGTRPHRGGGGGRPLQLRGMNDWGGRAGDRVGGEGGGWGGGGGGGGGGRWGGGEVQWGGEDDSRGRGRGGTRPYSVGGGALPLQLWGMNDCGGRAEHWLGREGGRWYEDGGEGTTVV